MNRSLLFILTLLLFGLTAKQSNAQLQAGNYTFTALSGTYTPLVGGTPEPSILVDTKLGIKIPLGFTFYFEGVAYDTIRPSSNGFLSFNRTASTTNSGTTNDLDNSNVDIRPNVAPLWDDLDGRATGGSSATYMTVGTAPNRKFIFEWSAWEWNYASADSVISFQAILYETTNVIEFVYKQEWDAVNSGSASIGISGAATGTGNFLSLSNIGTTPTASSTSETTSISTKPATGQVYRFTPPPLLALDMKNNGTITPKPSNCYGANETIKVIITNLGATPIDFSVNNTTVGAIVTGPNPATLSVVLNSGTLPSYGRDTITVSSTYNMTAGGVYGFKGFNSVSGDGNTANDTANAVTLSAISLVSAVEKVNFNGFNSAGDNLNSQFIQWREGAGAAKPTGTASTWRGQTGLGFSGNATATLNLYNAAHNEWIYSSKFVAGSNLALTYKVAVTDWLSVTTGDVMGADDKLFTMVSTDCGNTWTKLDSVTVADNLTTTLVNRTSDLSAYEGQEIMVAFLATDGPVDNSQDYDLHIDDIEIKQIDLLSPANGAVITAEGNPTSTLQSVWTQCTILPGAVTYRWVLDTLGGDFSNPYIISPSDNSGADTTMTFDLATIDGLLASLGLNVGDTIDLIWTARAYSGSDSSEAKEPFHLRLVRGILLQDFNLLTPANGTVLTIEGHESNILTATWEQSVDSATYVWVLESSASIPITMIPTNKDEFLSLTYGDIDALLSVVPIGTPLNLQWTVGAIIGNDTLYAANGYFTLDLTRGVITQDYGLLTPSTGTAVTIEGAPTQTIEATWEEAQANGNGDVVYTWLLDLATGDFSAPLLSIQADNSGSDEKITIEYEDLGALLRDNGIAFGGVMNAKWTVITDLGDTAVAPFAIDLTRGLVDGIASHGANTASVNVYPNPSNGQFNLVVSDLQEQLINVDVYSITGSVVMSDRLAVTNGQVKKTYELSHLEEGLYFVKVYTSDSAKSVKLTIQR